MVLALTLLLASLSLVTCMQIDTAVINEFSNILRFVKRVGLKRHCIDIDVRFWRSLTISCVLLGVELLF